MSDALHMTPEQGRLVRETLRTLLPEDARVLAFGSRATGRGLKPGSDLDLLIDTHGEDLPLGVMAALRDAFAESDLPFAVDLLQRCDASAGFLDSVESGNAVQVLG